MCDESQRACHLIRPRRQGNLGQHVQGVTRVRHEGQPQRLGLLLGWDGPEDVDVLAAWMPLLLSPIGRRDDGAIHVHAPAVKSQRNACSTW